MITERFSAVGKWFFAIVLFTSFIPCANAIDATQAYSEYRAWFLNNYRRDAPTKSLFFSVPRISNAEFVQIINQKLASGLGPNAAAKAAITQAKDRTNVKAIVNVFNAIIYNWELSIQKQHDLNFGRALWNPNSTRNLYFGYRLEAKQGPNLALKSTLDRVSAELNHSYGDAISQRTKFEAQALEGLQPIEVGGNGFEIVYNGEVIWPLPAPCPSPSSTSC